MTSKGRRQRLKGEDEFDVVDPICRRVAGWDRTGCYFPYQRPDR